MLGCSSCAWEQPIPVQQLENASPQKNSVPLSNFNFSPKISLQIVNFHTASMLSEISDNPEILPPSPMPTSGRQHIGNNLSQP